MEASSCNGCPCFGCPQNNKAPGEWAPGMKLCDKCKGNYSKECYKEVCPNQ